MLCIYFLIIDLVLCILLDKTLQLKVCLHQARYAMYEEVQEMENDDQLKLNLPDFIPA